jgi:serine/threonine protein kinase
LKQTNFRSKDFRSFLTACLQKDPTSRRSAKELLSHPFISATNKNNLSELLTKHKKLKEDAEQNSQEVTKKWEAFLGELEQKKQLNNSGSREQPPVPNNNGSSIMMFNSPPEEEEEEVTLEEYPTGTIVVSKKPVRYTSTLTLIFNIRATTEACLKKYLNKKIPYLYHNKPQFQIHLHESRIQQPPLSKEPSSTLRPQGTAFIF